MDYVIYMRISLLLARERTSENIRRFDLDISRIKTVKDLIQFQDISFFSKTHYLILNLHNFSDEVKVMSSGTEGLVQEVELRRQRQRRVSGHLRRILTTTAPIPGADALGIRNYFEGKISFLC